MTLKQIVTTITSLGVIIGAFLAVDHRYFLAVQAAEMKAEITKSVAQTATELRIESYRTRIMVLNGKDHLTKDEQMELDFSRELVKKLQLEALGKK